MNANILKNDWTFSKKKTSNNFYFLGLQQEDKKLIKIRFFYSTFCLYSRKLSNNFSQFSSWTRWKKKNFFILWFFLSFQKKKNRKLFLVNTKFFWKFKSRLKFTIKLLKLKYTTERSFRKGFVGKSWDTYHWVTNEQKKDIIFQLIFLFLFNYRIKFCSNISLDIFFIFFWMLSDKNWLENFLYLLNSTRR